MKTPLLGGLVLALAMIATPAQAQTATPIKNFDVFVDPPTGFVFVKLPQGWKFVGKVDTQELNSLPPKVITSLLRPEREEALSAKGD